jgi:hypothetical protein
MTTLTALVLRGHAFTLAHVATPAPGCCAPTARRCS